MTLADFSAVQQGDFVLLTWETNSELNNRGFNLYRGTSEAGPDRQLNETLIPSQSPGSPGGFIYTWEDCADLIPGVTYFYWVEDVDIYGTATLHGPVSATYQVPTAVTLAGRPARRPRGRSRALGGHHGPGVRGRAADRAQADQDAACEWQTIEEVKNHVPQNIKSTSPGPAPAGAPTSPTNENVVIVLYLR